MHNRGDGGDRRYREPPVAINQQEDYLYRCNASEPAKKRLAFSERTFAVLASNLREKSSVSLPQFMPYREIFRGVQLVQMFTEREREEESERTGMISETISSLFFGRAKNKKIAFDRRKRNVAGVAAKLRRCEFKSPVLPERKIALCHGCFKVLSSCRLPDCERVYNMRNALCLFRLLLLFSSRRCGKEKHLWMRLIDSLPLRDIYHRLCAMWRYITAMEDLNCAALWYTKLLFFISTEINQVSDIERSFWWL